MGRANDSPEELPDAEHLLTLLAVAEGGNESAAAELLGVGQSSVSRRLAGLQQRTDTPLTRRTPAGTRLTPAGAALLPFARDVRDALIGASRLLAPGSGGAPSVRLGVSPHLVPRLSGSLAGALSANEPLALDCVEGSSADLLAAVRAGRLDAAITTWAPAGSEPGLSALELGSDRVVLAGSAGGGIVTAGGAVNAGALRSARVLLPRGSSLAHRGRSAARAAGVPAHGIVELPGPAAVRTAALSGEGIAVTLASYVAADAAAAWLTLAPLSAAPQTGGSEAERERGKDEVGVWLLINDSLEGEGAERLTELALGATRSSQPR